MNTPFDLFAVECGKGWQKLYQPLLDLAELYGAKVLQVKEKFGGLRFYFAGGGEKHDWLRAMVDAVETVSFHTCEECGEDGQAGWDSEKNQPIYKTTTSGGWLKSLCSSCRDKNSHRRAHLT